jgi:hypothetical protein
MNITRLTSTAAIITVIIDVKHRDNLRQATCIQAAPSSLKVANMGRNLVAVLKLIHCAIHVLNRKLFHYISVGGRKYVHRQGQVEVHVDVSSCVSSLRTPETPPCGYIMHVGD